MILSNNWSEYSLIDCSGGKRLEKWGKYILIRPDPQVIWSDSEHSPLWKRADASYERSHSGGGAWGTNRLPESWKIAYERLGLVFLIKPMGFKHTGVFPEQAANWEWMYEKIRSSGRQLKVLNLFAYTGGASLACAKAGAAVTHVDASKGMVAMAKENAALSGLQNAPIRYIVDDCRKFVEREIRRGNRYDGIVMDPPSYGRGPSGETWKLEECIWEFVKLVSNVLSDDPCFFVLNSYTTGLSASTMGYMLNMALCEKFGGKAVSDELGLPVSESTLPLPCGAVSRWSK